jgi:hypothetical protein
MAKIEVNKEETGWTKESFKAFMDKYKKEKPENFERKKAELERQLESLTPVKKVK